MEIVQDSVSFVNDQTSAKDGVNPTSIKDVSDEDISRGLVVNASMIVSREVRSKLLFLKVDKKVIIPRVIGGDE
jgi:hypothetical protein